MGKLTGLFNRGGTNTGDVIRQSTSLTMAYLLEQNRKFEAFMRDKVAELEGRVAAQQQTRLDYFDDDEAASPDVVEDELDWESEQDLEPARPLMSLAADVDEPLGLSATGLPAAGFGPLGADQVTAQEQTVQVKPVTVAKVAPTEAPEPVQAPPSWLVMLGVGEPEPAGEEEISTALDQGAVEVEPVEEDETGWSEITAWKDMTEGDPGNDPADEETEDETDGPENTVREDTTEDDSGEDLADEELGDEETEETAEVTDENLAKETREEEPISDEEMDWPEVGMPTGVYQDEAEPMNDLEDEQEEAEWEEELAGEEEMDWPEAEMPAVVEQDEGELKSGPDGEQEEAGGTADQDEAEGEAEVELPGEKEVDGSDTDMPAVVKQAGSEVEPDPHEGPVEEIDQGPSEGVTSPTAVRMKVRKQGGVLEVGTGTVIGDEEGEVDSLLPPWLTAKL